LRRTAGQIETLDHISANRLGVCFTCANSWLGYFGIQGMSDQQYILVLLATGCALMVYGILKTRSRRLTPKERIAQLKRRKPIARKAHLKTCSNALKNYREVPRWKLERWAREKRATQIDEHGMPIWPAELAFYLILRHLTQDIRIQQPFYTPATFILRDFYVPGAKLVFEIDGSTHGQTMGYDAECDEWLAGKGIRTVRINNRTVQRSPHIAEQVARQALGL
jgi:very-short-patch-repair endonuclease